MEILCLNLLLLMTSVRAVPQPVDQMTIERRDDVITSFYPYDQAWTAYKQEFDKDYRTIAEEEARYNIFLDNVREIEKHNAEYLRGAESYYMGINMFTDMTEEEKQSRLGFVEPVGPNFWNCSVYFLPAVNLDLPDQVDWRTEGYVTPVKNQGACGSCWAFSTTGALEGQHFRKTKTLVSLSEQQLVDCSSRDSGCNGGLPSRALQYIKTAGGLESESDYPYKAKDGQCRFDASKVKATVSGCVKLPKGSEQALQQAVASVGPISVAVTANTLQGYMGGILDNPACDGKPLNHAILVVGYGSQGGKDYWLIKNSWGTAWGMGGYAKMARNKNNQCGIANVAVYPLV